MQPFYVHQQIELPKIELNVSHYILQQCDCPNCGKTVKAKLPPEVSTGYGARFTALIGELSGIKAMSRNDVKQLCESVFGISIATGTIQKIVDRNSQALLPVYNRIGQIARSSWCNNIDETSWFKGLRFGVLWRKRSLGTQSEKGNRWVERILSLKETCRLKAKATFPVLIDCVNSYFQKNNLIYPGFNEFGLHPVNSYQKST